METCSNCGAVARPGAKFCTVCGSRLDTRESTTTSPAPTEQNTDRREPDSSSAAESTEDAPTPAASQTWSWGSSVKTEATDESPSDAEHEAESSADATSTFSWSWGQSAQEGGGESQPSTDAPADTQAAADLDGSNPTADEDVSSAPLQSSDPAEERADSEEQTAHITTPTDDEVSSESTTPPASPEVTSTEMASDESAVETEAPSADGSGIAIESDDESGEQLETLSSWAARWNADDEETSADAESASEPVDFDTSLSPMEGAPGGLQPDQDETPETAVDATPSGIEGAPGGLQPEDEAAGADEPVLHGIEGAPAGDQDALDPLVGMEAHAEPQTFSPAFARDDKTDARARAEQLIDELRDLIPALGMGAASSTTNPSTDLASIASDLEEARPQQDSANDLRALLERARSNPRDIDSMLDLVNHAGDLLDVLDSRDKLNAAAGDAIGRLRESNDNPVP
ncbi:MAG: zinc-ribbon domain-containing protein [Thermomicrobiales bacterium]